MAHRINMIKNISIAISALFLGINISVAQTESASIQEDFEKFNTMLYQVNKYYVDSVDTPKLVEDAIRKVLEDLDPHSVYIPKKELQKMNEPLVGNFDGIGVQFNILKDTIVVVNPIPGGPSEKLGIKASDKIVAIEGENVAGIGITNSDVVSKLRGKKGTVVNVEISRRGEKKFLEFAITRDKIPIFSVDAGYMATPKTGYIKVNRFAATTMEEFHKELAELQEQGMENLILDLQGNGGGYLKTAIALADEFLTADQKIVYTEGRTFKKEEHFATERGSFESGKLVVLIDEGSASASEIVSGAIQDWDRGIIIGRRSFGKGLVQKPFMLPDGSAMRLTISRYYTPSGRCIQKPYEDGVESYIKEKYERYSNGELFSLDSIVFPDSLKFSTSKNRVVYGGGGILPDVFVPIDTNGGSNYFSQLIRKGIINTFTLDIVDQKRKKLLKEYPTVEEFKQNFTLEGELLAELIKQGEKEGIEQNEEDLAKSKDLLLLRTKALIARNLYNNEAFYYIINDINDAYQKALEAIDDGTYAKTLLADK